jgi:hypothetical protein
MNVEGSEGNMRALIGVSPGVFSFGLIPKPIPRGDEVLVRLVSFQVDGRRTVRTIFLNINTTTLCTAQTCLYIMI